jgi:hypothetical protein
MMEVNIKYTIYTQLENMHVTINESEQSNIVPKSYLHVQL